LSLLNLILGDEPAIG